MTEYKNWMGDMDLLSKGSKAYQDLNSTDTGEVQGAIDFAAEYARDKGLVVDTSDKYKVGHFLEGNVVHIAERTAIGRMDEHGASIFGQARSGKEGELAKKVFATPVVKTRDSERNKTAELHERYAGLVNLIQGYNSKDKRVSESQLIETARQEVVEAVRKDLEGNKYLTNGDIQVAQASEAMQIGNERMAVNYIGEAIAKTESEFLARFPKKKAQRQSALADYAIGNIRLSYENATSDENEGKKLMKSSSSKDRKKGKDMVNKATREKLGVMHLLHGIVDIDK